MAQGSYIVNTGGCNDCHTNPEFAPGGNPFLGEPEQINVDRFLAGGREFGPFRQPQPHPQQERAPGWVDSRAVRDQHENRDGFQEQTSGNLAAAAGDAVAGHRQAHRLESAGDLRLPELDSLSRDHARHSDPTLLDPDVASHVVTVRRRLRLRRSWPAGGDVGAAPERSAADGGCSVDLCHSHGPAMRRSAWRAVRALRRGWSRWRSAWTRSRIPSVRADGAIGACRVPAPTSRADWSPSNQASPPRPSCSIRAWASRASSSRQRIVRVPRTPGDCRHLDECPASARLCHPDIASLATMSANWIRHALCRSCRPTAAPIVGETARRV